MIKAVIFDLGGTLYKDNNPSKEVYRDQWNEINERGYEVDWEEYREALGKMQEELRDQHGDSVEAHQPEVPVRILFDILGLEDEVTEEDLKEIGEKFWIRFSEEKELKGGAYEVIECCKDNVEILGLISNGNKLSTYTRLEKDGLKGEFDIILYSTGVGATKSELKLFKIFLERTNLAGRECMMVGNREDEDTYAKKFGMKTVLITEDKKEGDGDNSLEPDMEFKDLNRFKEAIENGDILKG